MDEVIQNGNPTQASNPWQQIMNPDVKEQDDDRNERVKGSRAEFESHLGETFVIQGANLLPHDNVQLDLFTNHFDNPDLVNYFKQIQDMYFNALARCDETTISPMEIDNDGKIDIHSGMLEHRFSMEYKKNIDIERLKSVSELGVIASEWFGIVESEAEAVFCAFLNITNEGDIECSRKNLGKYSLIGSNVNLFFDEKNPVMQDLMRNDFFNYIRRNGECEVDDNVRELFDDFIGPLSAGKDSVIRRGQSTAGWVAIPGGIPSRLINGVCINTKQYDEISHGFISNEDTTSKIQVIAKLFPYATIFDRERNVLAVPEES